MQNSNDIEALQNGLVYSLSSHQHPGRVCRCSNVKGVCRCFAHLLRGIGSFGIPSECDVLDKCLGFSTLNLLNWAPVLVPLPRAS